MTAESRQQITRLLSECEDGDPTAVGRLVSLLYEELREIAHRHLQKEAVGHTIRTTALVHEAYLGLVDSDGASWNDRVHFLAAASRAMRHILIDHARRRAAEKRGGTRVRVPLEENTAAVDPVAPDILDLDAALTRLERRNGRLARVIEYRFFGGMTVEETAKVLEVAPRTVKRDWTRARVYLKEFLEVEPDAR